MLPFLKHLCILKEEEIPKLDHRWGFIFTVYIEEVGKKTR